jgi:hypothetical protein
VYPFPTNRHPVAMTWQGEARMRFRMPGGYFRVPTPGTGQMTYEGIPSVVKQALDDLYGGVPIARTESLRRTFLEELGKWRVQGVIAGPDGRDPATAIDFLAWVLGRPPSIDNGVAVWHGLR